MSMSQLRQSKSLFQRQLEREILRRIILWVIAGCLLFCIPIFGINYLNTYFNVNGHLNFLDRTFDEIYKSTAEYIENPENLSVFLRCVKGGSNDREVQYTVSKYNVSGPVRINMILMDINKDIAYTSFSEENMNLHRIEFNKIVAENLLGGQEQIYNTVYFFSGNSSEYVFTKLLHEDGRVVGFVTVYLNGNDWSKLFSAYQYDCIITNQNGDIIYCSKSGFLPERGANKFRKQPGQRISSIKGIRYILSSRTLPDHRAVLYSLIYTPGNTIYILLGVFTILILGTVWIVMLRKMSHMMAEKNAASLRILVDEMRIIRRGNNRHTIRIESGDEFEEIAAQINKMLKSINELNTRNTDLIKLNSMIEMRNLQTQINPHFIYNSLDTIKYLIITDSEKASHLIERFTHILRYSINNTKQDVLLSEDRIYIEDYLYVQKTRFGDRFICSIDIEECCKRMLVPKLLLQPLIENSIKYGFKKHMNLSVWIRGWCDEEYFFLQVSDDGPGVSGEELEQLRKTIVSEEIMTEHNGLQNLCRRIILKYGEGCGLFIDSVEGKSFTVTAKLLRRGTGDV